ncbi:MAG: response regulator [Gemmatimonadaceae bacterium]
MSPRRVLVIDDEEDIHVLTTMILEMGGDFEVSTAESGAAGIECARRDRPDAILLDYSMPDLDGPATFARLRSDEMTRAIPVIFLTGKAHGELRSLVVAIGADGVIAKPVDPLSFAGELSDMLDRLIAGRST